MPEDWRTAVCVVAHPDDVEYGPAAAVARWTGQGKAVSYLLLTSGEQGIEGMPAAQAGPLREQEERAGAQRTGVHDLAFLRYPDGALVDTAELRANIARELHRRDPELVVLLNHHAQWAFGGANSDDHRAAGQAALGALRAEPLPSLRWVAVADAPGIDHAVDVTQQLETGLAALREHRAYLDALGGEQWSVDHVVGNARRAGELLGTQYAVAFELVTDLAAAG
ncbi:PIG-L family deacetylase [Saccharopolyspora sp. HNM0983]|uniref:PIG-L family deacetylase n=2 Tax=Saccharopolyspora montiporae TaxID=2781240 RepID=A0A929FYR0_9PSEU|nr:PIG-L family deacetylase [Saccharopolyspora sp. HNM0983]